MTVQLPSLSTFPPSGPLLAVCFCLEVPTFQPKYYGTNRATEKSSALRVTGPQAATVWSQVWYYDIKGIYSQHFFLTISFLLFESILYDLSRNTLQP
jgi:hypothetical protein